MLENGPELAPSKVLGTQENSSPMELELGALVEFYHVLGAFLLIGTSVLLIFNCSSRAHKNHQQVQRKGADNASSSGSDVVLDFSTVWLSCCRDGKSGKTDPDDGSGSLSPVTIVITPPSPKVGAKPNSGIGDSDSIGSSGDLAMGSSSTPSVDPANKNGVVNVSADPSGNKDVTKAGGDIIVVASNNNTNNNNNNNNSNNNSYSSSADADIPKGDFVGEPALLDTRSRDM